MTLEGKRFSHYHIIRLIGRGSMGEVYLIEDVQVQRQIAAKVIRLEAVPDEQETVFTVLRLFWREATAIARLDHPHILPLYDHGEAFIDGSHIAYLIMPYRPEGSLITWLRQRKRNRYSRQLTMKQAIHVVQQASQALQYAHDHQVMHLDVKPANFLIRSLSKADEYPDLLLSDFGIARLVSATARDSQQVRGTPIYMSPEQWNNRPVFASDQYALAIMAYELLTGIPPFEGGPLSVMFAHIHQKPWPVHNLNPLLPPTVDPVLQRALAKNPEERFPTVAAFAQAFQNAFPAMPGERTLRVLRLLPVSNIPASIRNEPRPGQAVRSGLPVRTPQAAHFVPSTPQPGQHLTAAPTPVPGQEQKISTLSAPLPPQNTTALSVNAASPLTTTAHKSLTRPLLPLSRHSTRLRSPATALLALLLLLLLLAGGLNAYKALSHHQPIAPKEPLLLSPGQRWHQYPGSPQHLGAVIWLGSLFLGIGNNGTIFTSPNGKTWTPRHSNTSRLLEGATWSGSLYVIVGDHGTILTSPDGKTWTPRHSGTSQNLYDVTWSGSLFLAVGDNGVLLRSLNGNTWTQQILNGYPSLYGVLWSNSLFMIVESEGILTSPNGTTWTNQATSFPQSFDGLIWSGSLFVVVGDHGTILTSPNGTTWTLQRSGTSLNLYDIDWSGSLFVTVGQNGTLLTSSDGNTWTPQHSGTSQDLNTISCARSLFITVAQNGTLFTSP